MCGSEDDVWFLVKSFGSLSLAAVVCIGMWDGVEPEDSGDHYFVDFGGYLVDVNDFCGVRRICLWCIHSSMRTFLEFLVEQDAPTVVYQQPTMDYTPGTAAGSSVSGGSTLISAGGDVGISNMVMSLDRIKNELRDIFAGIRASVGAFQDSRMRGRFEQEMLVGIGGIGRAHAILLPSASGRGG